MLVALPGGPGTASEVSLALRYRKPLIVFLKHQGEIPERVDFLLAFRDPPGKLPFATCAVLAGAVIADRHRDIELGSDTEPDSDVLTGWSAYSPVPARGRLCRENL